MDIPHIADANPPVPIASTHAKPAIPVEIAHDRSEDSYDIGSFSFWVDEVISRGLRIV
jgi:hypothetical protein